MSQEQNNQSEQEFVKEYQTKKYPAPYLTADVVLFSNENERPEVLMIRRGNHPFMGKRAFPGGFVDPIEDTKTAAIRELEEETGVVDVAVEPVGFYSSPKRDPRGWIVSEVFYSICEKKPTAVAADDARDAAWFLIEEEMTEDKMILHLKHEREEITITANVSASVFEKKHTAKDAFSDEMAFDHAQVLADAWLKVRSIV